MLFGGSFKILDNEILNDSLVKRRQFEIKCQQLINNGQLKCNIAIQWNTIEQ